MKYLKEDFLKIAQKERGIIVLMLLNLLLSIALAIFTIVKLNPNSLISRVGYGDIGGYRDGPWNSQFVFVISAVVFGILHNLLAFKIFHKRGGGMTKFFLITTTMLIFGAFVVLVRLLREG